MVCRGRFRGPIWSEGSVAEAIAKHMPVIPGEHTIYPHLYACPNVVLRDPDTGRFEGATHVMTPPSGVAAA